MVGPMQKLDKCPINPACVKRRVFRDDKGNIFTYNPRTGEFANHECNVIASELANVLWCGEWLNRDTGRTRYTLPSRKKSSAKIPPSDNAKSKSKHSRSAWIFIQYRYVEIPEWKELKEDE